MSGPARALWGWLCRLPVLRQDALLYLVSALFAVAFAAANTGDYHVWAVISVGPYAAAAVAGEVGARTLRSPGAVRRGREILLLLVFGGVVLAPLTALVVWRAEGAAGPHAQPEVRVIEAAGDRAVAGHDPYLHDPRTVGVSPTDDDHRVDDDSYFPYLPGMVPFGMTNSLPGPKELGDARLVLTGFTILVAAVALLVTEAPRGRRGRALQVLLVLPTGAMPITTGGDDLPVLALMLLALVLAERRQPVLSGIAAGAAGTLKLTAWPLLLVLALAQRDPGGRRISWRYLAAVAAVAVPVVLLGFLPDPSGFVTNVVAFPLGLAHVKSPAASPLLGQVLTTLYPAARHEITVGLLLIGVAAVAVLAWRFPPTAPFSASRLTGLALLLATVLAPATRFGYLIYPVNLLTWAYMLAPVPGGVGAGEADDQSASSTWTSSSSTRLVGAV